MISLSIPNIVVQKVSNGYVVQWQKVNTDKTQSQRTTIVSAVCQSKAELLLLIEEAAGDIAEIPGCN